MHNIGDAFTIRDAIVLSRTGVILSIKIVLIQRVGIFERQTLICMDVTLSIYYIQCTS